MVNGQQRQLSFGEEPFPVRLVLRSLPQTFTVDPVEGVLKHSQAERRSPEESQEGPAGGSVCPHRLYGLKGESGRQTINSLRET